ncbi:hypothetical protein AB0E04_49335 [Streptomyces sp. NPDC048251]|uniref:hypothetical protein n=1 Tax=Streptomyces sp. NPDC048251 TaxID=3154501 RepID=UPI003424B5A4
MTVPEEAFLHAALGACEAERRDTALTVRRDRVLSAALTATLAAALFAGLAAWHLHQDTEAAHQHQARLAPR